MAPTLYAPGEFWAATEEVRAKHCNGCGSELDVSGKLVPDTMYGLDVRSACCIHDWMYAFGKTAGDKLFADAVFMMNMAAIIISHGGWLMLPRLLRATKYYVAVATAGNDSFWYEKERNNVKSITFRGNFQ
jgi:hypothetical protein